MLKDIIDFIVSRTALTREASLREINYAWEELWNSEDVPDSLQEISVAPLQAGLLSLPYYIGQLRAVKEHSSKIKITLNTPRAAYQAGSYFQSPFTWRILGSSPLKTSIVNASIISLSITESESEQFSVTLEGPTDNASKTTEVIIFNPGETTANTTKRFTDLTSATKSALTASNVALVGPNSEDYGFIPNDSYEARNILVQILDRCSQNCSACACYDILYKRKAPILINEGASVPLQQVLMTKALEWILLSKEGQGELASAYSQKAVALLEVNVNNDKHTVEHKLELPVNPFVTRYHGSI